MKKLIVAGLLGMVVVSTFTGCIATKKVVLKETSSVKTMVRIAETIEEVNEEMPMEEIITEVATEEIVTEVSIKKPIEKPTEEQTIERPTENVVENVNRMFKKADEFYLQNNGKCQDILDEIELNYPEYADKVEERRNYYIEYPDGSKLLLFEEAFDYSYIYGPFFKYDINKFFEDNYGNKFYDYAKAIMSETNKGKNNKYVVYNSEGKYDTFEGKIVCYKEVDEINTFHAEVYGDGELIYTSETINGYSKPLTFTANISGYELIKVCLVREDDYLTIAKSQPSVALVDAKFYNQVLPEFIPFEPIVE